MARANARSLWKAKLEGKAHASAARSAAPSLGRPFRGTILGVDPSLRGTGLAVVDYRDPSRATLLRSETLKLKPTVSMAQCLAEISLAISRALASYRIDAVALEQTIYVQNVQTAQILGAARGAAIAAAAVAGTDVFEYPPLRVKQSVVGFGRASKEQVARTTRSLLSLGAALQYDESDAAAVALCHAFTWREG